MGVTVAHRNACGGVCLLRKPDCAGDGAHLALGLALRRRVEGFSFFLRLRAFTPTAAFLSGGDGKVARTGRGAPDLGRARRHSFPRHGETVCHGDGPKRGPRMPGKWGRTSLSDFGGRGDLSPGLFEGV